MVPSPGDSNYWKIIIAENDIIKVSRNWMLKLVLYTK